MNDRLKDIDPVPTGEPCSCCDNACDVTLTIETSWRDGAGHLHVVRDKRHSITWEPPSCPPSVDVS